MDSEVELPEHRWSRMEKFKKAFRRLPDPRADNARHELLEVLFIALAATLCGAKGPSDMATFGQSKEGLLRLVLQLQHGVPSHDTFSRVFRLLDPQAFEAAFRRFMAGFAKANGLELRGVVAVDGKALRGAFERGRQSTPLHMVNVWAAEARMCLAQRKAPGRNEAAGALEVLGLLDLEGCIVIRLKKTSRDKLVRIRMANNGAEPEETSSALQRKWFALLLYPVGHDVRLLTEKFHPCLLHAWVMFCRLDETHETHDVVHEPGIQR